MGTVTLDKNKLPKHLAVIMDGNGRWAKKIGENRSVGHQSGVNSVREIVESCVEFGIEYLTLYAFSTENWKRPKEEIDALMTILINKSGSGKKEVVNLCLSTSSLIDKISRLPSLTSSAIFCTALIISHLPL